MPDCRICGASCSHAELDANGCVNCQGSPECARCGHARSKHSGSYGNGAKMCRAEVPVTGESLAVGRCACPGFIADGEPQAVGVTDVQVLSLRPPASR
jgi:hypothetical protein